MRSTAYINFCKNFRKNGVIYAATAYFFVIFGCRATAPQSQISDFEITDETSVDGGNGGDVAGQNKQKSSRSDLLDNPEEERKFVIYHPKEPTAWFTRRMLMISPQPSAKRINECRERVEAAIKDAPNLRALNEVSISLEKTILESPNLYHWCFYQMMADLDTRLDSETPLMTDKAEIFLSRMRSLWVMAKGLDQTMPDQGYLTYLRIRYTDISQNVFGRNLEPMDIDSFRGSGSRLLKSAGRFED